ncbi:hypothetical protein CLCR_02622 [Cladophialophora carrionii]|uniref:Rhodopsin domain-containing protein n=1 Tax=Cladophialophora carrionii TaxID=86049 RepID=A0A1C1CFF0_9EURO|nr:hypothetical protein CLCR_02622 [Cladophialophora carrionii]
MPVAFYWDKNIEGGHCIDMMAFWFSFSGFNIVTDVAVWVLPMPVLWKLQLPRKQKISLVAVFALGGFNSTDLTYDNVGAATWSAAELNVGIMCACIPALRPMISMIFPRLLATTRRDHGSNPYPPRAPYMRDESAVELSQNVKAQSEISRDDSASYDNGHEPNSIRVKNEWSISERERA